MQSQKEPVNLDDCWILVYTDKHYQGKSFRLFGPARYPNMRIEGHDLHNDIESCKVGPAAYVRCYDEELFENTLLWLLPNQQVTNLGDAGLGDRIDSIEVFAQAPKEGDQGYEEYLDAVRKGKV